MRAAILAAIIGAPLAASCGSEVIAPPDIHWGVQECSACSMSIHDERFACALVRIGTDGRLESLACDDLNCLVELLDERPPSPAWTIFVRDYGSHAWITADKAHFLRSSQIKTPMAACVASFGSAEGAKGVVEGATLKDFAAVADEIRKQPMLR